ncbi:presequence protease, mitochondrial-like isoform X18 [Macaca fascicularis]|uniref:presequence protease, mitochondrial-like isoform X18 n=1 Tax=Macaca fascicularis TaxID=9541 RepID=UPI003D15A2BC
MRRVALGALQGLSSRRRLRRCIGRLEVLGVLAPGRGRSRAGRRHAHHRAWRWNSNRACERALRYQLGDKIHGFTVNQDKDEDVHTCRAGFQPHRH